MAVEKISQEKLKLLWLQSGGCGGCTLSLFGADAPDLFSALELTRIEVLSHPSMSEIGGRSLNGLLTRLREGQIPLDILCIEGALLRGPKGSGRFHLHTMFSP